MKKDIHPQYVVCKVSCSCGNTFSTMSLKDEIVTDLCSNCHPFYTGEQKIVDTENLVAKFEKRQEAAKASGFKSKKEKMAAKKAKLEAIKAKQKANQGLTLKDMLANLNG